MCCVLRYMWQQSNGDDCVLRKPELDAFLATALSPELRNPGYLAEMRLEMVTVRGVHLATMFVQVSIHNMEKTFALTRKFFVESVHEVYLIQDSQSSQIHISFCGQRHHQPVRFGGRKNYFLG